MIETHARTPPSDTASQQNILRSQSAGRINCSPVDTSLNIVKFELSGFQMDALDQEMLRELRAFADRESTTVEETISMILEWYVDCEARLGARNAKGNVIPFPRSQ